MTVSKFFRMVSIYEGNGVTYTVKTIDNNILFKGNYYDMLDSFGDRDILFYSHDIDKYDYDGYETFKGIIIVK